MTTGFSATRLHDGALAGFWMKPVLEADIPRWALPSWLVLRYSIGRPLTTTLASLVVENSPDQRIAVRRSDHSARSLAVDTLFEGEPGRIFETGIEHTKFGGLAIHRRNEGGGRPDSGGRPAHAWL